MLVIMKRKATETELEQVKQFLVEQDCDFTSRPELTVLSLVWSAIPEDSIAKTSADRWGP